MNKHIDDQSQFIAHESLNQEKHELLDDQQLMKLQQKKKQKKLFLIGVFVLSLMIIGLSIFYEPPKVELVEEAVKEVVTPTPVTIDNTSLSAQIEIAKSYAQEINIYEADFALPIIDLIIGIEK